MCERVQTVGSTPATRHQSGSQQPGISQALSNPASVRLSATQHQSGSQQPGISQALSNPASVRLSATRHQSGSQQPGISQALSNPASVRLSATQHQSGSQQPGISQALSNPASVRLSATRHQSGAQPTPPWCSCHWVANTIRSVETGPGEEVKRAQHLNLLACFLPLLSLYNFTNQPTYTIYAILSSTPPTLHDVQAKERKGNDCT